jgi:glycosyltransferase involved in cell wall biosynthesis
VVVPAHNEAALLPRLLATLKIAAERAPGGVGQVELIVADNASTDGTAAIAQRHGCRVVAVEKRAIAAARNGGAHAAHGEVLCFVDADMQVHAGTFPAIERALRSGGVIAGATGLVSERWSPGIALTWVLLLPMVWLMGIDSGVVFCRRSDFLRVGGYREEKLAAEDVDFLLRLKKLGRGQGQRFVRLSGVKAIMSARKFDQHGDWHYLGSMARLGWLKLTGRHDQFERGVRAYWYEGR